MEGKRSWWIGRASNPVGGAKRCRVGSTPIPFRQPHSPCPVPPPVMNIAGYDFPDDLWLHVEHQVWARPAADGIAVVGITALGIHLAGEIYMCRLKPVGTVVEQGRGIGVVELAKTIVSVKSALSGTVVEINRAVEVEPELIRRDPYGDGWLARIHCSDWTANAARLMRPGDAVAATEHYLASAQRPDRWTDV